MDELRKYMPGYDITVRYYRKTKLYEFLRMHGDMERAMKHAEQLSRLSEVSPEDKISYSQVNRVLRLLSEWTDSDSDQKELITGFLDRIGEVGVKIIEFFANSSYSDVKPHLIFYKMGLRLQNPHQ